MKEVEVIKQGIKNVHDITRTIGFCLYIFKGWNLVIKLIKLIK